MLSEKQIMNLLRNYANSPEGRKKIKEVYGIDYDPREKETVNKIKGKAEEMRRILFKHIKTNKNAGEENQEWIKSFSINDIIIDKPQKINGEWSVKLSLNSKALRRESLYEDEYREGVYDIILLLSKGYHAKDYVYGLYKDRKTYSYEWVSIRSKKDRDPDPFLENAINEFNDIQKDEAKAELIGKYQKK